MMRHTVIFVVLIGLLQALQTSALKYVAAPGTVGGDVNQSAALEWTLDGVPGSHHSVAIVFNGIRVFQYTPYSGKITLTNNTDPRISVYNTTTKGVGFRLERLLRTDGGNYTCELTGIGVDNSSAILLIHDVPTIPTITATPSDYVEGKTDATLNCTAGSTSLPVAYRPAMLYTWSRNGVDIDRTGPPERHAVIGDSGQTLEISPVHHTDNTYMCTASENGTHLASEETEVTLDVLYGPLNISIHPENPTLAFNETLVVTAYATCHPTCDFEWQLRSDVISLNATLTLGGSETNSTETYQVTAANEHWSRNISVSVTYIPGKVPDAPTTSAWTIVTNSDGNSSAADPGTEDNPDDNTVIIIAVSVVLAVVVIATIVIVVVVLVRKKKSKENGTEEFEELTPYVTVSRPTENVTQPGSQPGNQPGNRSGNPPQADGDPLSGQPHPEVIPPVIYAEVIKKTKGAGSNSKPTVNGKDDAKPPGKPPPTAKKPTLRERPLPIAPPKVPDMDKSGLGLTNAAFEETGDDMTTWEHTYSNISAPSAVSEVQLQEDSKDQGQSPEGITYADIAFVANGNVNNDVVRREVEPTEYATLKLRHTVSGAEDC